MVCNAGFKTPAFHELQDNASNLQGGQQLLQQLNVYSKKSIKMVIYKKHLKRVRWVTTLVLSTISMMYFRCLNFERDFTHLL